MEIEGEEADDCIATIATQASQRRLDSHGVVSGDLDLLQLVDAHCTVVVTRRGISEMTRYDADAVRARFGLAPEQLADYRGLKGDPSDNLPGVPGIGEKTAAKLIAQFGIARCAARQSRLGHAQTHRRPAAPARRQGARLPRRLDGQARLADRAALGGVALSRAEQRRSRGAVRDVWSSDRCWRASRRRHSQASWASSRRGAGHRRLKVFEPGVYRVVDRADAIAKALTARGGGATRGARARARHVLDGARDAPTALAIAWKSREGIVVASPRSHRARRRCARCSRSW